MEKFLQQIIDTAKEDLTVAKRLEKKWHDIVYLNVPKQDETLYWLLFDKHIWNKLTVGREKTIKKSFMKLAALRGNKGHGVSFNEIERAKIYPIEDFMDFNHNGTHCVFHTEKTASMHYYRSSNRVHCFGCNKSADSIDVYMAINNCDFITAVKALQL